MSYAKMSASLDQEGLGNTNLGISLKEKKSLHEIENKIKWLKNSGLLDEVNKNIDGINALNDIHEELASTNYELESSDKTKASLLLEVKRLKKAETEKGDNCEKEDDIELTDYLSEGLLENKNIRKVFRGHAFLEADTQEPSITMNMCV